MALPDDIKGLLENGVHFGHLSKHWNPKMKNFIFGKKKNVYIIDLEKTAQKIQEAKEFIKQKAQAGEKILFVATKKQLRSIVKELAIDCDMPYVVERWVGGLLTNFSTVRRRINKYQELIDKREKGEFEIMVKKEVVKLNREIERMERSYSGVATMGKLPDCVFIVDTKKETACVREANRLSIPVIALIDTDANPDIIDYPIPGNDDSIKSVRHIVSSLVEAIKEGLEKKSQKDQEVEKEKEKLSTSDDKDKKTSSKQPLENKKEENIKSKKDKSPVSSQQKEE